MAPNNALSNLKSKRKESSTNQQSVIDSRLIESRGVGSKQSRDCISEEIQSFLQGEAKFGLHSEVRGFFTVWTFLTRLPGPTWVDHHPGYLMRGMAYFPLGGMLIGIFVSTVYDMARGFLGLPAYIAACFAKAASLWVTGCFHEDGLADSADGFGGGWSRDQILKIMQDTRLGTYGAAVLLLYVVTKLDILASLGSSSWRLWCCKGAGPALVVAATVARTTAPLLLKTRRYIDEGGPKYQYYTFMIQASHLVTWERVTFALTTCFVVSALAYGCVRSAVLTFTSISAAYFAGRYGEFYLGGVMGDFLGATICVTEIIILTSIFLMQDQFQFQDIVNSFMKVTASVHPTHSFLVTDNSIALLKFILIMSCVTLWCLCVGHPPGFVRESVVAAINSPENDDEVRVRLDSVAAANIENINSISGNSGYSENSFTDCTASRTLLEKCLQNPLSTFNERYEAVLAYLDKLAKPVGSLGTLEDWAARLASLQRKCIPSADEVACVIFCADHGVAASTQDGGASCSAYPQYVTRKIARAIIDGAAGAAVFSRLHGASLYVVDVGLAGMDDSPRGDNTMVISSHKIQGGTKNFCVEPAMSIEQVELCITAGRQAVKERLKTGTVKVLVFGEVGIGNTTASSAILASLTGIGAEKLCDGGATLGRTVDEKLVAKKIAIVGQALQTNGGALNKPILALAKYGGAEIASLTGAILEAGDQDTAVLVDGFICCTAAAVAAHISPGICKVLFFATQSTEKGQKVAMECIQRIALEHGIPAPTKPVLQMDLRLGEGTGALLSVPVLRSAAAVLSKLKTLDEVLQ